MKNIIHFIIAFVFTIMPVYAYEGANHYKINEAAVGFSQLDHVLKSHLEFVEGLKTNLNGFEEKNKRYEKWSILKWISKGGEYEDYSGRYINHFHDPLKNWGDAGLKDVGDSALLWAQQGQESFFSAFGEWTWGKARQNFYDALTTKSPGYMRERYWAKCFRGLGQLMHLVSDMSVPAHTRNDVHVLPIFGIGRWHFETWCLNNIDKLTYSATDGDSPDSSVLFNPQPESGYEHLAPITGLFDRNQYTETTPLTGTNIGLTEYSNANFYSKDTIWCCYKYPQYDYNNLYCETVTIDGKTYKKRYHKNMQAGIQHLAAVSRLWYEAHHSPVPPDIDNDAYLALLNEKCWEEYAAKLLPRAIGYSANLIDYFFRGKLEITPPERYLYGIADPSTKQFKEIKLKLKNTTPGEEMSGGALTAVIKYRAPLDENFDPVATAPLDTDYIDYNSPDRENSYSYSVSQSIEIGAVSSEEPQEFTFDFTDAPIPTNAVDLSLMVVYQGKLGLEEGAVAAQYKDLCEPDHIHFWNLTDYFCLNRTLYAPAEIAASKDLRGQLDYTGDGKPDKYYFASPINIYITFTSEPDPYNVTPDNYTIAFEGLPPGNYGEVVVLQDQDTYYYSAGYEFIDNNPGDSLYPPLPKYYTEPDEGINDLKGVKTYLEKTIVTTADSMGIVSVSEGTGWYYLNPAGYRGMPRQNAVGGFYLAYPYTSDNPCGSSSGTVWPDAPGAQAYPPIINQ